MFDICVVCQSLKMKLNERMKNDRLWMPVVIRTVQDVLSRNRLEWKRCERLLFLLLFTFHMWRIIRYNRRHLVNVRNVIFRRSRTKEVDCTNIGLISSHIWTCFGGAIL